MNKRLNAVLIATLIGLAVSGAQAQNQWGEDNSNPGEFGLLFGAGNWNCRHWLSSPTTEKEGGSWILGWWTATNQGNAKNHFVGDKIGEADILSGIRARCQTKPQMALSNAVAMSYFQIGHSNRKIAK
jgi:hypothetical protein